jgi:alpha-D-ribose 1-methylphosphonate 5-triphosphate synthase subunit PhnH
MTLTATRLAPGFADPVRDSTRAFRAVMDAMANPGTVQRLDFALPGFAGVESAAIAALLTLADGETPVWLSAELDAGLAPYLRFHCGCPIVGEAKRAAFALIGRGADAAQAFGFEVGSDEYPDRSATVLIQVEALTSGAPVTLHGPGIKDTRRIAPKLPAGFWDGWRRNAGLYPRGIDVLLICGQDILALPRSSQVKE